MRPRWAGARFQTSKVSEHGQSGHHQGEARFLGGYRLLLRRQEEFAHHDRQAGQEEVRPGRAQARRIPRVQDQVSCAKPLTDLNGALRPRFDSAAIAIFAATADRLGWSATIRQWRVPRRPPPAWCWRMRASTYHRRPRARGEAYAAAVRCSTGGWGKISFQP